MAKKTGKVTGTEPNVVSSSKGMGHAATHDEAGGTATNLKGVSPNDEGFIRRPAGGGSVLGNPDASPDAG